MPSALRELATQPSIYLIQSVKMLRESVLYAMSLGWWAKSSRGEADFVGFREYCRAILLNCTTQDLDVSQEKCLLGTGSVLIED